MIDLYKADFSTPVERWPKPPMYGLAVFKPTSIKESGHRLSKKMDLDTVWHPYLNLNWHSLLCCLRQFIIIKFHDLFVRMPRIFHCLESTNWNPPGGRVCVGAMRKRLFRVCVTLGITGIHLDCLVGLSNLVAGGQPHGCSWLSNEEGCVPWLI